ncbi:hypothetical protein HDU96_008999 [Phlyctochytrium bullatum]|nr:hypothetical protein HDU96_008999 [Phlyctochytrium bullatum]
MAPIIRALVRTPIVFKRQPIPLSLEESHHLVNVMRLKESDPIWIASPTSDAKYWIKAELVKGQKKGNWACAINAETIDDAEKHEGHATLPFTLEVGISRPATLELVAEKAVELGASKLRMLLSSHASSSREASKALKGFKSSSASDSPKWRTRMDKVALEALKQCGRIGALDMEGPVDLPAVKNDIRFVAVEPGISTRVGKPVTSFFNALQMHGTHPTSPHITFTVGPEGGWTAQDVEMLLSNPSSLPVTLAPATLRTETACIAGMGCIAAFLQNK